MTQSEKIEIICQVMKLILEIDRYQWRAQTPSTKRKLKTLRSNLTRTRKKLIDLSLAEINALKEIALKRLLEEDPQRYQLKEGFRFSS